MPRGDPASPPAFDGVVHPDHHGTIRYKTVDDHDQQATCHGAGIPAGPVEELMVAGKVLRLGAPGHPEAGADGALARCQHGAHYQDEHVLPAGSSEARAQRLQPIAQDLGDGIAWRRREHRMMLHPMLRILRRPARKPTARGEVNHPLARHSRLCSPHAARRYRRPH